VHPNWHIITGGVSTGKTALFEELVKRGYSTVQEAARLEIDDAAKIGMTAEELRDDEEHFQEEVLRRRALLETGASEDETVFLNRGVQDSLAYYRYYNFEIEPWANEIIEQTRYGLVFLLEPLGYNKNDYARTEVSEFNDYITDLLTDAYTEHGMKPIWLPQASVDERIKIILDHLKHYKPTKA